MEQEKKNQLALFGKESVAFKKQKGRSEATEYENIGKANKWYLGVGKHAAMQGEGAVSEPFGSCHGGGDCALQSGYLCSEIGKQISPALGNSLWQGKYATETKLGEIESRNRETKIKWKTVW